jgi:uncharacterized membrane protein
MKKDWTLLIGGIGLGTGLMYLLDLDRGRRRRASLRDQMTHAAHATEECWETTFRNVRNRAQGVAAETRARLQREETSDEVLIARVRTALGRAVSHPRTIQVSAEAGQVSLGGSVPGNEVNGLLAAVARVRGVRNVENRLEVHSQFEDVPALPGGSSRPMRHGLAKANWDPTTRLLLGVTGGALAAYGAARRDARGMLAGLAGLGILGRAATNLPLDRLTGLHDSSQVIDLHTALHIDAPPEEVFAFCVMWENFPRFMSHVREVQGTGQRSHWVVDGPGGVPIHWDAEVTQFEPNKILAWKSVESAAIRQEGMLRFDPNPDGSTRLDVRISYNPPAGAVGHALATLLGANPAGQMDEDLVRLKSLIEDGRTSAPEKGEITRDELALEEGEAP